MENTDEKKRFREICEESPEICEDMAKEGFILDLDKIRTCQKQGVKFKEEFVKMIEKMDAER